MDLEKIVKEAILETLSNKPKENVIALVEDVKKGCEYFLNNFSWSKAKELKDLLEEANDDLSEALLIHRDM